MHFTSTYTIWRSIKYIILTILLIVNIFARIYIAIAAPSIGVNFYSKHVSFSVTMAKMNHCPRTATSYVNVLLLYMFIFLNYF